MNIHILIVSVLLCVVMATSVNQYYKISMVSSNENPNQPALFLHGESPVWDAESQTLYFVDVHAQNIHKLNYITGKISTKHIGYGQVNVISLISGSKRLLVSVRAALYLMDWTVAGDASLRLLASVDEGEPDNIINEGKADVEGRFWVGTKGPQSGDDVTPDRGTLYTVQQDTRAHVRTALRPVSISNGIAFALNNSLIYYIDSPTQKIEAFDFDSQKGEISGRRTIIDVTSYGYDDAIPDGMTIDSKGHLWVALMFGGSDNMIVTREV
ncbi:PREDICTED: regucalcin-like [Papilio xuthus]|uniref:Regucalcin-like n=1 Tax=Papilio xuthus TaxID=66420 RepID=A0AAJ7E7B9_PAPXU|nr:PREDICTED: regucalcin-like [Papilio xuthus]